MSSAGTRRIVRERRESRFGELLRERGCAVDADAAAAVGALGHPGRRERRRYDTRFFVAALPDGRREPGRHHRGRASADWVPSAHALEQAQRGERGRCCRRPIVTLASLPEFAAVADVLAASDARSLAPVRPRLSDRRATARPSVTLPDGSAVAMPAGAACGEPSAPTSSCARSLPHAAVVLQDNPGPMTLDGTNTWLLRAPGSRTSIVVDPGDRTTLPTCDAVARGGRRGRAGSCSPTGTSTTAGARRRCTS